ncbi:MAG TPA: FAD-dependent oxidoreductase [Tenuifilaceae bacterium]|nr:FAD-dependent oxidoreductase [Tenuifilaceae bacterium]HPE17937.1 FAD-dependent oxidoreductase [Tenuifilaceae bacterium]HPJ45390.1 FAD-dependent oxidoreductase [Tenuifilaceae bacterium]HPQ33229.1 FAD-dependent oxidoreductase [Tenuifilaceae bacterium]HRX67916.1 FAD-dependent oxidoreductase [Tenuifilaceae bacterium]
MSKKVAIIGGGVAGIEAAKKLSEFGYEISLFEKDTELGGHVAKWDRLFPNQRRAQEVVDILQKDLEKIQVYKSANVQSINRENGSFSVNATGKSYPADAVVVATGFELFPAEKKEEYGYQIFDNVITSADLELMFKKFGKPQTVSGVNPSRVAIIHCVGSRDEKVNRPYCSKVCCVTAVKQAIEIKESLPNCEVFNFYMDLRLFGPGYEELYKKAQTMGVTFVRGRLSETSELEGGRILVKAEDTLSSKPLKMSVDMVVLMVGMSPNPENNELFNGVGLAENSDGFLQVNDYHTEPTKSQIEGIFIAGACSGPNNITDSINAARSAAMDAHKFLTRN